MEVTLIPNKAEPVINWGIINVVQYTREESGLILLLNVVGMDSETQFLGLCILNTSSLESYQVGRLYPGSIKDYFKLYDGQVTLNN